MQLYPTRTAAHLAITGLLVVVAGVAMRLPFVAGWGGALVLAMAIARAVTLVSVSRIRAAGFEMLWSGPKRVSVTPRGGVLEIEAEVRNRDTLAARFVKLRAIASSQLDITIEPRSGEVPASGRLKVVVKVHAPRVGRHGIHGLALEVHGASGLFEVPLTFANPFGVEVIPRPFATFLLHARGGRSRLMSAAGRPGKNRGDGTDLRELRQHQHGDPFRRIAWKASARRGTLLVREFEREERDIVWVMLDASADLWAGPLGRAPLDMAIDEAASIATRHLRRGDRVGLVVVAASQRLIVPAANGPGQGHKIAHALTVGGATYDADRSDLDEADVASRVIEHLRPLDSKGLSDVRRGDLDKLAGRADTMRGRAPFAAAPPVGRSTRERSLRRYLAAFGIDSPARVDPDRGESLAMLLDAIFHVAHTKPRPSLIHVVAPPPGERTPEEVKAAVRAATRSGCTLLWSTPPVDQALAEPWEDPTEIQREKDDVEAGPLLTPRGRKAWKLTAPIVAYAVLMRARASQTRRESALRKLGVRVVRLRHVHDEST